MSKVKMDLDYLLENRDTRLYWNDAWQGNDGSAEVVIDVQQSATVEDCIRIQRWKSKNGILSQVDDLLLDQFIVINWAYTKEQQHDN